jgi:hypothetical protein
MIHQASLQSLQSTYSIAIDLTGNWKLSSEKAHPKEIRHQEPALKEGEHQSFWQTLEGIDGDYAIEIIYNPLLDTDPDHPGDAIDNKWRDFDGLSINDKSIKLNWVELSNTDYRLALEGANDGKPIKLGLTWKYTRGISVRLYLKAQPKASVYQALKPQAGGELLVAHGIPFRSARVSYDRDTWIEPGGTWWGRSDTLGGPSLQAGLALPYDGSFQLDAADTPVKTIHFLGMLHLLDWGNGSWYTPKGDHRSSHFVGDRIGAIVLNYTNGQVQEIPLIIGWNVWYGRPWDIIWHFNQWGGRASSYEPGLFGRDPHKLRIIPDAVALVDGIRPRGSISSNARFIFSVNLEGKKLRSISLKNEPDLNYGPLISAVTIEPSHPASKLETLPSVTSEPSHLKMTTLKDIREKTYEAGVQKIMRLFYTFVDELPKLTQPSIPKGYFGPKYNFGPKAEAIYTATLLYHNGPALGAFIADTGNGCSSTVFQGCLTGNYTECCGAWIAQVPLYKNLTNWFKVYKDSEPGNMPGLGQAWSRGIGEMMRESMAFGYDKFIVKHTVWLDRELYAKTSPPHWYRVPGLPNMCNFDRMVGAVHEITNRETDGHGICMWGRAMMWHWLGRSQEWNEKHWQATVDSVEWIQWQLDNNKVFPGIDKDILYAESECGPYEIYGSYNCLHGIKLAIRMAEQLHKEKEIAKWTKLYERLRKGILDNAVEESEFGPIWHTYRHTDWQDHAHKMVFIHLATEGDTYTPLQDYAKGDETTRKYLEISKNTYRWLMRKKDYDCLRMYGYGQGMMTQAALLMDEMGDAEKFVDMLVTHAYLPQLGGWGSPEGIVTHRSGKYYQAVNGYAGQDSHIADSTKALRLMLGLDDNDPSHLRLVPRFPASWAHMSIKDYPVLTGNARQKLAYDFTRTDTSLTFVLKLEHEAGPISVRLGPLPANKKVADAKVNNKSVSYREEASGDSRWVWVEIPNGAKAKVEISLQ